MMHYSTVFLNIDLTKIMNCLVPYLEAQNPPDCCINYVYNLYVWVRVCIYIYLEHETICHSFMFKYNLFSSYQWRKVMKFSLSNMA